MPSKTCHERMSSQQWCGLALMIMYQEQAEAILRIGLALSSRAGQVATDYCCVQALGIVKGLDDWRMKLGASGPMQQCV